MRILGRIVGVRSTEQSVGIKVGGLLTPTSLHFPFTEEVSFQTALHSFHVDKPTDISLHTV